MPKNDVKRQKTWRILDQDSGTFLPFKAFAAAGVDEVYLFLSLLHTHLVGKKVRVRHFRDGIELPIIDKDDTYDFNFQETRSLPAEVTVLPVS